MAVAALYTESLPENEGLMLCSFGVHLLTIRASCRNEHGFVVYAYSRAGSLHAHIFSLLTATLDVVLTVQFLHFLIT